MGTLLPLLSTSVELQHRLPTTSTGPPSEQVGIRHRGVSQPARYQSEKHSGGGISDLVSHTHNRRQAFCRVNQRFGKPGGAAVGVEWRSGSERCCPSCNVRRVTCLSSPVPSLAFNVCVHGKPFVAIPFAPLFHEQSPAVQPVPHWGPDVARFATSSLPNPQQGTMPWPNRKPATTADTSPHGERLVLPGRETHMQRTVIANILKNIWKTVFRKLC